MSGDLEQISQLLDTMENNIKVIESNIASLVFYMGGGLNYNDAWLLTVQQREVMNKVIEKHYAAMNPDSKSFM